MNGVPVESFSCRIGIIDPSGHRLDEEHHRVVHLEHTVKPFLTLPERLFCSLSLRDILDNTLYIAVCPNF